jgi:hypothetical protein
MKGAQEEEEEEEEEKRHYLNHQTEKWLSPVYRLRSQLEENGEWRHFL